MIDDPHVEKILKINGQKIPVWLYGDPKNPPIIEVHGYLRAFSQYKGDLPARHLMKNYYVIAFDLPGFGVNIDIKQNPVDFINEIVNKLVQFKTIVFLGESLGGALVLKYASIYPERVRALVIAATPIYPGFSLLFSLAKHLPGIKNKVSVLSSFLFLTDDNLSKINKPVLLLYSAKDRLATVGMGEKLSKYLPNSQMFVVNRWGHRWFLHEINRSGVLEAIEMFLRKLNV